MTLLRTGATTEPEPHNEEGSLVRPVDHGHGRGRRVLAAPAGRADDQWAPGAADARADRHRDHAGLSDGVHADGHGRHLRVARLPKCESRPGNDTDARPHGPASVFGHVERRADLDPAVRVHGLPGRTREPDREAVPQPAPGTHAHPRIARGGHAGHVRRVRDRDRHRRRGGHADGAARAAGHAARRIQRQDLGGRDHGGRLPRHPDPAVGHADRLRRHGRRVGGQALRRRVLPGNHAGGALHRLCDDPREVEAGADAAAGRK